MIMLLWLGNLGVGLGEGAAEGAEEDLGGKEGEDGLKLEIP
jgi:hypothetical protein